MAVARVLTFSVGIVLSPPCRKQRSRLIPALLDNFHCFGLYRLFSFDYVLKVKLFLQASFRSVTLLTGWCDCSTGRRIGPCEPDVQYECGHYRWQSRKSEEAINITPVVDDIVAKSGVRNGLVNVMNTHTSAGLLVTEGIPCLEEDILTHFSRLFPEDEATTTAGIWITTAAWGSMPTLI